MPSRTYEVDGMETEEDESSLVSTLEKIPGVDRVTPDREVNELTIEGDAEDREIRRAITDAGFQKGGL